MTNLNQRTAVRNRPLQAVAADAIIAPPHRLSAVPVATNGRAQALAEARKLEAAAAELGTKPYWLRLQLRQRGLALTALVEALKQERAALEQTARTIESRHRAEQRQESRAASRPSRADHLKAMRRRDPELRTLAAVGDNPEYLPHRARGTAQEQAAASRQRQTDKWQPLKRATHTAGNGARKAMRRH